MVGTLAVGMQMLESAGGPMIAGANLHPKFTVVQTKLSHRKCCDRVGVKPKKRSVPKSPAPLLRRVAEGKSHRKPR